MTGVQHEAKHADLATLGYTRLLDEVMSDTKVDGSHDATTAARAARFIGSRTPGSSPFFLACGFFATHRAGKVQWHNPTDRPQGDPRYVRPPACLPDTPDTRADFADYCESARRLDGYMATVFDSIDSAGQRDNTLIVCTADHGIAFPGMKCNLTDHGIGVMLMLRGPGFEGGRVIDPMVTHMDIFPTLCEMAGIEKPAWLRGKSLLPLVRGEADSFHERVCATVNYHAAYEPQRAVRTTRHKYIRRWNLQPHPILPNCDDSVSKSELLRAGWRGHAQREEVLYDLVFDPNEACDVSQDPRYADALKQMRASMGEWMKQTNDPLQQGVVGAPPELVVNPVDGDSPQREPR